MIPAPRVFAAGWIITGTGGHATERPVIPSHGPDYAKEVDGPDAWRHMVRKAFKEGASVIKIASHFAPDEVRAGIEEAHLLGIKVTRSEEHTSELQSLMRISYAVFCLKKKKLT